MYKRSNIGKAVLAATCVLAVSIPSLGSRAAAEGSGAADAKQLVPLRTVCEAVGAGLAWDEATESIRVTRGDKTLLLQIGASSATVNGKSVTLEQRVQLVDDRTVLPLSLFNEALGTSVRWDGAKNSVLVGDLTGFQPKPDVSGAAVSYDMKVSMSEFNQFAVDAKISVKSLSNDTWKNLVFDFIPNALTAGNKPEQIKNPAGLVLNSVTLDGQKAYYYLDKNLLTVTPVHPVHSGENVVIGVNYTFTAPTDGIGLSAEQGSFFLAQWYPMLSTYTNHRWNAKPYLPVGQSYNNAFGDFHVTYDLPEAYTVISSSDDVPTASVSVKTGEIKDYFSKEMFIGLTKNMRTLSQTVDGVEIRVHGLKPEDQLMAALKTAVSSYQYYNQAIGKYPRRQLDIIVKDGDAGLVEPGVITVTANPQQRDYQIAREVAQQWFYGVVSSDPYTDGWLDEGLSEVANALYWVDHEKRSEDMAFDAANRLMSKAKQKGVSKASNLPLTAYQDDLGVAPFQNAQPELKLWDLFKRYGGAETARQFLKDYDRTYSYGQVSTQEFVRFVEAYFPLDDSFFADWLKLH